MSSSCQILNQSLRFATLSFKPVMTVYGYDSFKSTVSTLIDEGKITQKEQDDLKVFFELMDKLPNGSSWFNPLLAGDSENKTLKYAHVTSKSIVNLESFVTNSPDYDQYPEASKFGWDEATEILKVSKTVEKVIKAQNMLVTFDTKTLKRAKALKDKKENGEIIFKEIDTVAQFAEVEACVLYVPNSGYLDGRGGFGPLGSARLFETQGTAATTRSSRSLRNAVVVNVKASLTGMANNNPQVSGDLTQLNEAIAYVERKRLMEALESASKEQLLERLKKLDGAQEILEGDQEKEAPRRRRM